VRLFFPTIALEGAERVPAGPVIFVLNHPNALVDPLVLRLALGRPVRFLGKSTLFGNPVGRFTMEAFGAIPVHRRQDRDRAGAAADPARAARDAARNEETFALCRAALGRGELLALFPEGTSHSEPEMKPFKTGAARIALSAEAQHGGALGLTIVPVGLFYEDKKKFRSRALAVVGTPLPVAPFHQTYRHDEHAAVDALTEAIRDGLETLVLQADTRELLEGVAAVAVWTAQSPEARDDLAARHTRAQELLAAYARLQARDPERVQAVVAAARGYARVLGALGVNDPWALEVGRVRAGPAARALARLVLLFPFAAAGAALGYLPYRLAGLLARRFGRGDDLVATLKLLGALALLPLAWGLEGFLAARAAHLGWWGALVLVAGPATGYAAIRFAETLEVVTAAARHLWIRARRPDVAERLAAHRRALAAAVEAALRA